MEYYSDASYNNQMGIGVIGFMGPDLNVITQMVNVHGSTGCEVEAFNRMLDYAKSNDHSDIIAYTDCNKVVKMGSEIDYDDLHVSVIKVKGHSKMSDKSPQDLLFKTVDKAVRKTLRDAVRFYK